MASLYVDLTLSSNAGADGSTSNPFYTLEAALAASSANDTVYVRGHGGTKNYFIDVDLSNQPVNIRQWPGEDRAIFTSTTDLQEVTPATTVGFSSVREYDLSSIAATLVARSSSFTDMFIESDGGVGQQGGDPSPPPSWPTGQAIVTKDYTTPDYSVESTRNPSDLIDYEIFMRLASGGDLNARLTTLNNYTTEDARLEEYVVDGANKKIHVHEDLAAQITSGAAKIRVGMFPLEKGVPGFKLSNMTNVEISDLTFDSMVYLSRSGQNRTVSMNAPSGVTLTRVQAHHGADDQFIFLSPTSAHMVEMSGLVDCVSIHCPPDVGGVEWFGGTANGGTTGGIGDGNFVDGLLVAQPTLKFLGGSSTGILSSDLGSFGVLITSKGGNIGVQASDATWGVTRRIRGFRQDENSGRLALINNALSNLPMPANDLDPDEYSWTLDDCHLEGISSLNPSGAAIAFRRCYLRATSGNVSMFSTEDGGKILFQDCVLWGDQQSNNVIFEPDVGEIIAENCAILLGGDSITSHFYSVPTGSGKLRLHRTIIIPVSRANFDNESFFAGVGNPSADDTQYLTGLDGSGPPSFWWSPGYSQNLDDEAIPDWDGISKGSPRNQFTTGYDQNNDSTPHTRDIDAMAAEYGAEFFIGAGRSPAQGSVQDPVGTIGEADIVYEFIDSNAIENVPTTNQGPLSGGLPIYSNTVAYGQTGIAILKPSTSSTLVSTATDETNQRPGMGFDFERVTPSGPVGWGPWRSSTDVDLSTLFVVVEESLPSIKISEANFVAENNPAPQIRVTNTGVTFTPSLDLDGSLSDAGNISITGPVIVELQQPEAPWVLRYTVSGKNPTYTSPVYTGPIVLNRNLTGSDNTVIKARVYDEAGRKKSRIMRFVIRQ